MKKTARLLACAAALVVAAAQAHIVLEQPAAAAGATYKAVFKIGHGCNGSATTALTVRLPDGVHGAKPMPKAGWALTRKLDTLATPYTSHGKTITEDVSAVTWRGGPLPDAFYDEFVVQVALPPQTGPLWFKVLQECEQGQADWAEVPARGTSPQGLKTPAALLELQPAGEHGHQH